MITCGGGATWIACCVLMAVCLLMVAVQFNLRGQEEPSHRQHNIFPWSRSPPLFLLSHPPLSLITLKERMEIPGGLEGFGHFLFPFSRHIKHFSWLAYFVALTSPKDKRWIHVTVCHPFLSRLLVPWCQNKEYGLRFWQTSEDVAYWLEPPDENTLGHH